MITTPVGLARDLPARRVMRAQVGDQDLAVWRSSSGQAQAWGNRCPHRGMRLSYGFVRGDSLACAYHGWHYNCDAVCHYIPAHPDLEPPTTIKPVVFNLLEQDGLLWINTNGEAEPPALPADCVGIRSIALDCPVQVASKAFKTVELNDESDRALEARQFSQGPDILVFGNSELAESVLLLFQPVVNDAVADETVNVHVIAHQSWSTEGRVGISRWCESVRRAAEVEGRAK